ncbi:MAG: exopolysaccharide Pel transporter PelG, partial [Chloroflexi bacterium]|nr:exopolysaccharide Pel transporter PelG [Chloroflexota bacterium]
RYLADRLYVHDTAAVAATCTGVLLTAIPLLIVATPFLILAPFDMRYRLLAVTLFLTLSLIWLVMIFLSAARNYRRMVGVFVASYTLSLGAATALGRMYGLAGGLGGFTLGQVVCLVFLVAHVYDEFPTDAEVDLSYIRYARRYWDLVVIGLLYTVGIWIDSALHWFSPHGIVVAHFYHIFPAYDSAKLLAYLATIPASAIFLVHLETNFYQHYRDFYASIGDKGTFDDIERAKRGMVVAARAGLSTILKIQGVVALALLLVAPDVAESMHLPPRWVALFRLEVLAASGQFLMLFGMLLLLYLDQRRPVVLVVVVFAACNAAVTLVTIPLGYAFYGLGSLAAGMAGCTLALGYFRNRLNQLEYITFMLQPMAGLERRDGRESAERNGAGGGMGVRMGQFVAFMRRLYRAYISPT